MLFLPEKIYLALLFWFQELEPQQELSSGLNENWGS